MISLLKKAFAFPGQRGNDKNSLRVLMDKIHKIHVQDVKLNSSLCLQNCHDDKLLADKNQIVLSVGHHLKKFIRFPYAHIPTAILLINQGVIHFAFRKTLSYPSKDELTSSSLFGVGQIDTAKGFEVSTYPLPVVFPMEKSASLFTSVRHFDLEAISGDDLIFYLQGPLKPRTYFFEHFLFAFETDNRRWCRILSIDKDGTYHKQPIPFPENNKKFHISYQTEKPYKSIAGELIVWSPYPGRIRAELDDAPDDCEVENPKIESFYKEKWWKSSSFKFCIKKVQNRSFCSIRCRLICS